jgi:hypothetical protein
MFPFHLRHRKIHKEIWGIGPSVKGSPTTHLWRRREERMHSSYSFTTSVLDEGEWPASRPGRVLPPVKGPPGTHCTGGWEGPRAGLDTEARENILFASARDHTSIARSSSP